MSTPATLAPGGRVGKFGPGDALLGAITEPATVPSQVGAILWGMGVAEMKTARRLAKYGIVSMQIRISGPEFNQDHLRNAIYDSSGVAYCRAAMDKLALERSVTSFILMGNCACANLCFNTALVDARVTGLILTNPLITKEQLPRRSFLHKALKLDTWKRLIIGKINLRSNIRLLSGMLVGIRKGGPEKLTAKTLLQNCLTQDAVLPIDVDDKLRSMCARNVKILIACASTDDSLHFFRAKYRRALSEMRLRGKLWFEKVESKAHVFSTDDNAAGLLNETVSRWIDAAFAVDVRA